jgi:membrane-associated phospholipid phosphatase
MTGAETPRPRQKLFRFFAARLDRKSYLGLHLTVGLVVIAAGVWLFSGLLEAVLDNATLVHWDLSAAGWIHSTTTPLGVRIFVAITDIGSPVAMSIIALVGVVVAFVRGHRLLAYAWAAAAVGGAIIDYVLKTSVHRSRPEYAAAFLHGSSYSFPSGHAMGSIIGYGFLAYALVLTLRVAGWHRRGVFMLAALMTLLIGISRVYIGVHYPSDVVGGWAAGLAWLAVCITGYQVVSGRAALRHPPTPSPRTP